VAKSFSRGYSFSPSIFLIFLFFYEVLYDLWGSRKSLYGCWKLILHFWANPSDSLQIIFSSFSDSWLFQFPNVNMIDFNQNTIEIYSFNSYTCNWYNQLTGFDLSHFSCHWDLESIAYRFVCEIDKEYHLGSMKLGKINTDINYFFQIWFWTDGSNNWIQVWLRILFGNFMMLYWLMFIFVLNIFQSRHWVWCYIKSSNLRSFLWNIILLNNHISWGIADYDPLLLSHLIYYGLSFYQWLLSDLSIYHIKHC
jgi:hypothetical protein